MKPPKIRVPRTNGEIEKWPVNKIKWVYLAENDHFAVEIEKYAGNSDHEGLISEEEAARIDK